MIGWYADGQSDGRCNEAFQTRARYRVGCAAVWRCQYEPGVWPARWQWRTIGTILQGMGTAPRPNDSASAVDPEFEAERQRRLAWEAEGMACARASIAAGRLVNSAKVKAWIDSIGTDDELPVPYSGR